MDKNDTKLLLKGATSLLPDGASLVKSAGTGHEFETKNAIKGFVKSENQLGMKNEKDRKAFTNDSIKTPFGNKHNDPSFQVTPLIAEKEKATANSELKPVKVKLDSNKNIPSQTTVKKTFQKPGYSIFEMYLVALNVLLSLGILYTICTIIPAAYALQNPGSTLTFNDIHQLAKNIYDEQTPIIIEHCRKNLTSIVLHFENSPKYFEQTIAMIKTFFENSPKHFADTTAVIQIHFENCPKYFEDTITTIKMFFVVAVVFFNQYYEKMLLFVSTFYIDYMIPMWETLFEQISEVYEDFSQTMKTINT
jgi:hypothetical protein